MLLTELHNLVSEIHLRDQVLDGQSLAIERIIVIGHDVALNHLTQTTLPCFSWTQHDSALRSMMVFEVGSKTGSTLDVM